MGWNKKCPSPLLLIRLVCFFFFFIQACAYLEENKFVFVIIYNRHSDYLEGPVLLEAGCLFSFSTNIHVNLCRDSLRGMGVERSSSRTSWDVAQASLMPVCLFSFQVVWQQAQSAEVQLKEWGTCGTSASLSAVGLAEGLSIAININFTQILGKRIHCRDRGVCPGLCGLRSRLAGVEASLGCCSDQPLPHIRRYLCNSLTAWFWETPTRS